MADRKVEGQRPAGHRERQWPRITGAEPLEDGEEGGQFEFGQSGDDVAHRLSLVVGHHELVLQEALGAIQPVPVGDTVERVEEPGHVMGLGHLVFGCLAEPHLVEGGHGQGVEQSAGRGEGHPGEGFWHEGPHLLRIGPEAGREVLGPGVVAPGQHRPAKPLAGGLAVDPRHRVAVVVVAPEHLVHDVVEVFGPFGVDQDVARLHRDQLHGGFGDDPREAHPAGRGPEEFGIGGGRHLDRADRRHQGHGEHVRAETSVHVVVLAVDVRRNGSADGHKPGARCDRNEPTEGNQAFHQGLQAHPARHPESSAFQVDGEDPVQPVHVDHDPTGVLGGVPVAATEAPGDDSPAVAGSGDLLHQAAETGRGQGMDDLGGARSGPTPTGEDFVAGVNGSHAT